MKEIAQTAQKPNGHLKLLQEKALCETLMERVPGVPLASQPPRFKQKAKQLFRVYRPLAFYLSSRRVKGYIHSKHPEIVPDAFNKTLRVFDPKKLVSKKSQPGSLQDMFNATFSRWLQSMNQKYLRQSINTNNLPYYDELGNGFLKPSSVLASDRRTPAYAQNIIDVTAAYRRIWDKLGKRYPPNNPQNINITSSVPIRRILLNEPRKKIAADLGFTRERLRQIENQSLPYFKELLKKEDPVSRPPPEFADKFYAKLLYENLPHLTESQQRVFKEISQKHGSEAAFLSLRLSPYFGGSHERLNEIASELFLARRAAAKIYLRVLKEKPSLETKHGVVLSLYKASKTSGHKSVPPFSKEEVIKRITEFTGDKRVLFKQLSPGLQSHVIRRGLLQELYALDILKKPDPYVKPPRSRKKILEILKFVRTTHKKLGRPLLAKQFKESGKPGYYIAIQQAKIRGGLPNLRDTELKELLRKVSLPRMGVSFPPTTDREALQKRLRLITKRLEQLESSA